MWRLLVGSLQSSASAVWRSAHVGCFRVDTALLLWWHCTELPVRAMHEAVGGSLPGDGHSRAMLPAEQQRCKVTSNPSGCGAAMANSTYTKHVRACQACHLSGARQSMLCEILLTMLM